jgi:uracil-DNA glycosylase
MIPQFFIDALKLAAPSWRPILMQGLEAMAEADPDYLQTLAADNFLPTQGRLFAAFSQPIEAVRYVLVGEGPYPREASATGVCFMDGAVQSLWSELGLSKQVNRATSLRNFMKMLLVAEGLVQPDSTGVEAMAVISAKARAIGSPFNQTLPQLEAKLIEQGFLLLNAALVFRAHVPPVKEAKAWRPLFQVVMHALAAHAQQSNQDLPTLVLWGKIALWLEALEGIDAFPKLVSEHPYNLSFIQNTRMQQFFAPMRLLYS